MDLGYIPVFQLNWFAMFADMDYRKFKSYDINSWQLVHCHLTERYSSLTKAWMIYAMQTHQFRTFSAFVVGEEAEPFIAVAFQEDHASRRPSVSVQGGNEADS